MAGKYAAAFGIGALGGITSELLYNKDHWCVWNPSAKTLATCTVGNIYGWATAMAVGLWNLAERKNVPWWAQVLGATVAAVCLEGAAGAVSKKFHKGERKWSYPPCWVPFFDGYASVVSSLYFGVGVLLFYWAIYRPLLSSSS